jgi:hypothetical protein
VLIELSLRALSARLRVGRWHFALGPTASFGSRAARSSHSTCSWSLTDEAGEACFGQIAAFSSEKDAETLRAQLASEGELVQINTISGHPRPRDYEPDR